MEDMMSGAGVGATITADELRQWRGQHREEYGYGYCMTCRQGWPCSTVRLMDAYVAAARALEAREQRIEHLRDEMRVLCDLHMKMTGEEGKAICTWCDTLWPCLHSERLRAALGSAPESRDHDDDPGDVAAAAEWLVTRPWQEQPEYPGRVLVNADAFATLRVALRDRRAALGSAAEGGADAVSTTVLDRDAAQRELGIRYLTARTMWRTQPQVREAAAMLGHTEREYCDRFVALNYGPLGWYSTSTDHRPLNADEAFRSAE